MQPNHPASVSRRSYLGGVLAAVGTGLVGSVSAQTDAEYVLAQGDECVPLSPISGDEPVEDFYDYQLPEGEWEGTVGARDEGGPYYGSTGTVDLQRVDTSILFLYDGPAGLSLVFVHGKNGEDDQGGGSATFTIDGLDPDGSWAVQDDLYLDPETGEQAESNFDRWDTAGTGARVSWTWSGARTDGGAYRGVNTEDGVTIDPAFNADAERLSFNYNGVVTDWEALSETDDGIERTSLALDQPIYILEGSCEDVDDDIATQREDDEDRQEREKVEDDKKGENEENEKEMEKERGDDEDNDGNESGARGGGPDGNGPPGPDGNGPPGPDGDGPPGLSGDSPGHDRRDDN
jgi:hypothetical protein